jgi:hypothetical protein
MRQSIPYVLPLLKFNRSKADLKIARQLFIGKIPDQSSLSFRQAYLSPVLRTLNRKGLRADY